MGKTKSAKELGDKVMEGVASAVEDVKADMLRNSILRVNAKVEQLGKEFDNNKSRDSERDRTISSIQRTLQDQIKEIRVLRAMFEENVATPAGTSNKTSPEPEQENLVHRKVYLLREDTRMNFRSCCESIGVAVTSKVEAEKWSNRGHGASFPFFGKTPDRDYEEIDIVNTLEQVRCGK